MISNIFNIIGYTIIINQTICITLSAIINLFSNFIKYLFVKIILTRRNRFIKKNTKKLNEFGLIGSLKLNCIN
jgi:hypothetical protein